MKLNKDKRTCKGTLQNLSISNNLFYSLFKTSNEITFSLWCLNSRTVQKDILFLWIKNKNEIETLTFVTACDEYHFGHNCELLCECLHGVCDRKTGK